MIFSGPPNIKKLIEKNDIDGLIKALVFMKDPVICVFAAHAIAHMKWKTSDIKKPKEAISSLLSALGTENVNIRLVAARTLSMMDWKPSNGNIDSAYWVIKMDWEKCIEIGSPAVSPLIQMLNLHASMSDAIGNTLVRIGEPAIMPLIEAILNSASGTTINPWIQKSPEGVSKYEILAQLNILVNTLAKMNSSAIVQFCTAAEDEVDNRIHTLKSFGVENVKLEPGTVFYESIAVALYFVFKALLQLNNQNAILSLTKIFSNLQEKYQDMVVHVLETIGSSAIEPLSLVVKQNNMKAKIVAYAALRKLDSHYGENIDEEIIRAAANGKFDEEHLSDFVEELIKLYDNSPSGQGFSSKIPGYEKVRAIGDKLNNAGGMELMLEAHKLFQKERRACARNLESVWDNIGEWQG